MVSNKKEIFAYLHCSKCIHENVYPQWIEVGWTRVGIQVWCVRHNVNMVHIDFEGTKHPANTSAFHEPEDESLIAESSMNH